jgi:hypothetical protein
MRSRVSVTGSAAAGPSLRARRHNLNEPRKQSFPCFLRPPQGPLPAGAECPARERSGRHRARDGIPNRFVESVRFDRLNEPTGESTSELLHCHDLDATRFPSRGFHARHVARKSGVHHNCAARRSWRSPHQGSGKSEPVELLRHVKALCVPKTLSVLIRERIA